VTAGRGSLARVERVAERTHIIFDSGILFDGGGAKLRAAAQQNLRELTTALEDYEGTDVLVVGHTYSTGPKDLN
jgi:outer membrane protein OmpA-like peptidoglycan-associated protein